MLRPALALPSPILRAALSVALLPSCTPATGPEAPSVEVAFPTGTEREPPERNTPAAPLVVASSDDPPDARIARAGVTQEPCTSARTLRSIHSDTPMQIDFVNRTSGWIDTYWVSFDGRFIHYAHLPPGDRYRQETYVTHPWIALDGDGRCHGVFLPHEPGIHEVEIGPR